MNQNICLYASDAQMNWQSTEWILFGLNISFRRFVDVRVPV